MNRLSTNNSFTLIELLIVIGILAILVAAVVVVLNPAQLLAQARDSKRQQDLSALNQALNTVYALDQTISFGTTSTVYTSLPDSTTTCANWNLPSLPSGWKYNCVPTSTLQNTNGTGWIPVNLQSNGVVSLSSLPTDPVNSSSTGLYYTYVTGGSFQLASHFESSKFQATEGSDAMYTVGSNINLAPFLSGLVGYWPLNEGTGTIAYDLSGYNNNGTWNGTSTPHYTTSNGKTVGYFDGSDDYVNITSSTVLNLTTTVTVLALVKTNMGLVQYPATIVSKGTNAYFLTLGDYVANTPRVTGFIRTGTWLYVNGTIPINDNAWHGAAMTYNGTSLVVFRDGIVDGSIVGDLANIQTDPSSLTIGKYGNGYISGSISDLRIYNRALSASEVQALYNATK